MGFQVEAFSIGRAQAITCKTKSLSHSANQTKEGNDGPENLDVPGREWSRAGKRLEQYRDLRERIQVQNGFQEAPYRKSGHKDVH